MARISDSFVSYSLTGIDKAIRRLMGAEHELEMLLLDRDPKHNHFDALEHIVVTAFEDVDAIKRRYHDEDDE